MRVCRGSWLACTTWQAAPHQNRRCWHTGDVEEAALPQIPVGLPGTDTSVKPGAAT